MLSEVYCFLLETYLNRQRLSKVLYMNWDLPIISSEGLWYKVWQTQYR